MMFDTITRSQDAMDNWPKHLADYHARLNAEGETFFVSPGAMAFRIYYQAAVFLGESERLRTAIYLAVLGEMEQMKRRTEEAGGKARR